MLHSESQINVRMIVKRPAECFNRKSATAAFRLLDFSLRGTGAVNCDHDVPDEKCGKGRSWGSVDVFLIESALDQCVN